MSWDKLSMSERADIIKLAVQSGIQDLYAIRDTYNEFAKGGKKKSGTNLKQNFLTSLDQSLREDNTFNTPQYRQFFTDLAKQESGYYPTITNSIGAKGYFQLMPGNRSASWSNPTQQFHETYKLVKSNIDYFNKKLTKKDWDRARELGIDMYGLLGGAHLGGVGGVVRALRGKGNAKDMNGSSVLGYMRQFSQSGKPITYTQAPQVSQEASIAAPIPSTTDSDVAYNPLEVPQLTSLPPTAYTLGSLPTVEDIARQSALEPLTPEELRRQERHEKLERFQNVMGLMSRIQPSVQSSHLGNIASVLGQSNPIQYFSDGGSIRIKPENRGKFTRLKERTGHSASWFKENGTPAQKKMAIFALNSRHWKHGYGGNLFDGGGGILGWLKDAVTPAVRAIEEKRKNIDKMTYRGKPAEEVLAIYPSGKKEIMPMPKRQRANTSKTRANSENVEKQMRTVMAVNANKIGASNPVFDISYIPEKSILIDGSTTSTNVLDSLAKYAGIHNRVPQLSEHPKKKRSSYNSPRKINLNEMLGLSTQETHNGAMPYLNFKDGDSKFNRSLGNANYFTAFGYIPAEDLVRNFQYNKAHVDRNTPPLLDAFRYYAQGDYNPRDPSHTRDVNAKGKEVWKNPAVKQWWETSGKYWYNTGKGPKKK